jgi:hypothetical protein
MTFTPEDGSGLSAANAYDDVAFVDAYHADRGNALWTGADTVKEQAIVRATDYVDKRFGTKFRGFKRAKSQGLEWPRLSAFDNDDFLYSGTEDDVPRQLKKAIAEYALIALQIDLMPLPARPFAVLDPATGLVTSAVFGQVAETHDIVGPVEEKKRYFDVNKSVTLKPTGSSSPLVSDMNLPEYPVADEWLKELLKVGFSVNLRRGD